MSVTVPENMHIVHDRNFNVRLLKTHTDTPYFRLLHPMMDLVKPSLPQGYVIGSVSDAQLMDHINACYGAACVNEAQLYAWRQRAVYRQALWVIVCDEETGEIAASGIAEFDREIGEGMLEWIQVAPNYRRRGLGRFVVQELLWRMRNDARFTTVSGKCSDASNPEKLYRSCGFTGNDIWHVLRQREDI